MIIRPTAGCLTLTLLAILIPIVLLSSPSAAFAQLQNLTQNQNFSQPQILNLQQKGSPAADSIAVQFYLRPHENPYFSNMGIYQVSTWSMGASKGSTICPLGDCQYSIENPQFISNNNFTRGHTYLFTGLLNASVTTNGTTNSKFYPMLAQLDKTASQEKAGQTTESLQGTIQFGGDLIRCYGCRPEFEYKVDNGTLLVNPNTPVLTLQGTIH